MKTTHFRSSIAQDLRNVSFAGHSQARGNGVLLDQSHQPRSRVSAICARRRKKHGTYRLCNIENRMHRLSRRRNELISSGDDYRGERDHIGVGQQ